MTPDPVEQKARITRPVPGDRSSPESPVGTPQGFVKYGDVGGVLYVCEECGCVVVLPGNHDQHHRLSDPPWLAALNIGDAGARSATSEQVGQASRPVPTPSEGPET